VITEVRNGSAYISHRSEWIGDNVSMLYKSNVGLNLLRGHYPFQIVTHPGEKHGSALLAFKHAGRALTLYDPMHDQRPYTGPKLAQARKSAPSRSAVPKPAQALGRKTLSSGTLCMQTGMRSIEARVIRSAPTWP
jgi:hypothetical protein